MPDCVFCRIEAPPGRPELDRVAATIAQALGALP